jgi:hypothetical protein
MAAKKLEAMRQAWVKVQQHDDASWKALTETFDTSTVYTVIADARGIDLPFTAKTVTCEQVLLLAGGGSALVSGATTAALTVVQTGASGAVVGGSTFVLRARG